MRRMITIKAVPGRTVHDPDDNSLVTDSARTVPDSIFWRRRLSTGDVAEVAATVKNAVAATSAKPADQEPSATGRKSK